LADVEETTMCQRQRGFGAIPCPSPNYSDAPLCRLHLKG
jgi:hypothetical protein